MSENQETQIPSYDTNIRTIGVQGDLSYDREFRINAFLRACPAENILPLLESKPGSEGEEEKEQSVMPFPEFVNLPTEDEIEASRFISHVWKPPNDWNEQVATTNYNESKIAELTTLARMTAKSDLDDSSKFGEIKWFCDKVSLPCPISTDDHPDVNTLWGPIKMPIRDLHEKLTKDRPGKYSVLQLTQPWSFSGTQDQGTALKLRLKDIFLQPNINPTYIDQVWELPVGCFFLRSVKVVPEQDGQPEEFNTAPIYQSGDHETLREWQRRIELPDSVWVELRLGSVRSELMTNYADVLSVHSRMSVVFPWHLCDRLWSLCEWAVFLKYRPLYNCEILFEQFLQPKTLPAYIRNIRLLSIEKAQVGDERDRDFLVRSLLKEFHIVETKHYDYPVLNKETLIGCGKDLVVTQLWGPLENFIRGSMLAVICRTLALAEGRSSASREQFLQWNEPWVELAFELNLTPLALALRKLKAHLMSRDEIIQFFDGDVLTQVEVLRKEILPRTGTPKAAVTFGANS